MNTEQNALAAAAGVQPSLGLPNREETQQAFGNAPPYFRHFMDLFQRTDHRNIALLHENTNAIKGLATRVDSLDSKYEQQNTECKAGIGAVRACFGSGHCK